MSRIAYVNGLYLPHRHAHVHVEDRGYQFADGVYEVMAVAGGRVLDRDGHLDRLERSLRELTMAMPMRRAALVMVLGEVIRRNALREGTLYLQVTRGVARRDHPFPKGTKPAMVVTARAQSLAKSDPAAAKGIDVITTPDLRWARRDIKSISLLPNVLAKQEAKDAGAYEAWMVGADGLVTEGSSTNAWIVDAEGNLITRKADRAILNGITRQVLAAIAGETQLRVIERPFTVAEALAAREAFITSTTSLVLPVVRIDGKPVGNGQPGSVAARLRDLYRANMLRQSEAGAAGA